MSYVDSDLLPGEQVAYRTRLSRAIFGPLAVVLGVVLLALIGSFASGDGSSLGMIVLALVFAAPIIGIVAVSRLVRYKTTEFAVTNRRVIRKSGWLRRASLELNLSKIESLALEQGFLARAFGYGDIVVIGSGGTREAFGTISAATNFRREVQTRVASLAP